MPHRLGEPRPRLAPAEIERRASDLRAAAGFLREQGLEAAAGRAEAMAGHYERRLAGLAVTR
jgi:hypothetical protein